MSRNPKLLTVREVAVLVSRLEGRACSPRQIQYLLVTGRLAGDLQQRSRGQTRLFSVNEVTLVRLAARLAKEGVSATVTRVVLTYLRSDLIRAWKAAAPL